MEEKSKGVNGLIATACFFDEKVDEYVDETKELSYTERCVAESICHGYTDKEVAEALQKPVWTIRTHKKHIYNKLGISSSHEIVLYMMKKLLHQEWDLKDLKRRGLASFLCLIMIMSICFSDNNVYVGRRANSRANTSLRVSRCRRNEKE